MAPPPRSAFAFILASVFIDSLALGMIGPVLPRLLVGFGDGDLATGAVLTGLSSTLWAAMRFACSPALGALSDRFGRRRVILLSNLGRGADYVLMALAPSLAWFFLGRMISGITSASLPAAVAYIGDSTPSRDRSARFALLGTAMSLGFVIGPPLGGILGAEYPRAPFWCAAALVLVSALYGVFALPESLAANARAPFRWRQATPLGSLRLLRGHPGLVALTSAGFLFTMAHDSTRGTFVLYTEYRYGWDERTIGIVLGVIAAAATVVQVGVVGRLARRLGDHQAMRMGFLCGAAAMAVYGLAPTGFVFLFGIPFQAMFGLANPTLVSLISRHAPPAEQGRIQGATSSAMALGSMASPVVFSYVFAGSIERPDGVDVPGASFLLASLCLCAALAVSRHSTLRAAESPPARDPIQVQT